MRKWGVPSGPTLFIGILVGVLGMSYFIYGKRQERIGFLAAGVGLCIYPYLVEGLALQLLIGSVLLAAPFFTDL
jgi:lipid-A-disaccharide synthase-like uncharacterized protein